MTCWRRTIGIGLLMALIAVGCGVETDNEPTTVAAGSVTAAPDDSTDTTTDTTTSEPGELTRLAQRASEQLIEHATERGSSPPGDDPTTWIVTLEVDVPLTDEQLDDPRAALPAPFDQLATALVSLVVRADSPDGPVGHLLEEPFTDLRSALDGSRQVVTTVPGDDPPSTETWPVRDARIEKIALGVVDFDAMAVGPEIVSLIGADKVHIGLPGGWFAMTVAEARAGVSATLPPLTGTTATAPDS